MTLSQAATEYSQAARDFFAGPHGPFVADEFLDPAGQAVPVDDPATGDVVASVPVCGADVVDAAVLAARAALAGPWGRMFPAQREKLLLDLADAVERDAELLAEIESVESGKSLGLARDLGVASCARWLRYHAGWATKIEGSTVDGSIPVPPGSQWLTMTLKQPVGVVGAITPWNFPLLIAIWKLAPALACGCTIVLKPAEETPLGTLRLARLAAEVGFPAGVINVVTGAGDTGAALAAHPGVDKLAFTGSTAVGKRVGHSAVDRMARCTLELGGKSPMILLADVEPGSEAFAAGVGMFLNQGQVCTAASRLLIQESIYDETLANLASVADGLAMGSGRDPGAQINPLVSASHRDRVRGFVDRAVYGGAELVAGRRAVPDRGYYVAPTILHNVAPDAEIVRDEVFGPVVTAMPFRDLDEAIRLANDTEYGLSASVWTRDLGKALSVVKRLNAGTVWVNAHNLLDPALPFGGFKQSGVGREHGREVLDAYLETKAVAIRYS
jgi:phenylacetaldehyde dehydrogenase